MSLDRVLRLRNQLTADITGELREKAWSLDRPAVEHLLLVIADRLFDPAVEATAWAIVRSAPESCADFRRLVGSTPQELIAEKRVEAARRLLDHTSWSIGIVAGLLGFSSLAAFHRTFRRIEGQAPLDYRIAHMGQKPVFTLESVSAFAASARRAPGAEGARPSAPSFSS